ncbi:MAG: site-2 protease family protein [Myxococcota bacterium]
MRRALYIVTAGALLSRLYVLGEERGFRLVAQATVIVTLASVASWLAHMTLHELGHWLAARSQGFVVRSVRFGPVGLDFSGARPALKLGGDLGGGVNSLPRGAERLATRLRLVALAGPLVTLALCVVTWLWWKTHGAGSLATPSGIFLVMGGFTLVTALLPGVLLPRRPDAGTDLEMLIQPRAVLAHWHNAAAVQALLDGRRVSDVLDWRTTRALLPDDGPAEPFELGWAIAALDAGARAQAMARLRSLVERLDDTSPEWLKLDAWAQLGALSALEGDALHAQACLAQLGPLVPYEWYPWLLEACIARAKHEPWTPLFARWKAAAEQHRYRAVALGANRWILDELERG